MEDMKYSFPHCYDLGWLRPPVFIYPPLGSFVDYMEDVKYITAPRAGSFVEKKKENIKIKNEREV